MTQRVIAAVDFTPLAASTVELARSLAHNLNRPLEVLHIATHAEAVGSLTAMTNPEVDAEKVVVDTEQTRLDRLVHDTLGDGPATTHVVSGSGDTAEQIVAEATPDDLLVIGTHGKSRTRAMLLGSTAYDVIRTAPCPVVVARGP